MKAIRRPSWLRRQWVKWRHNGGCPCPHSHGETADSCWFCAMCQAEQDAAPERTT